MKTFLILIAFVGLIACEETEEPAVALDQTKQEIKQKFAKEGVVLDESQIDKIAKIKQLFKKYGIETKSNPASFKEKGNALLEKDIWEIEKDVMRFGAMKMIGDSITKITEYWEPLIKTSSSGHERDSLYRLYNNETKIMQDKIWRMHEQNLKALEERKQKQNE